MEDFFACWLNILKFFFKKVIINSSIYITNSKFNMEFINLPLLIYAQIKNMRFKKQLLLMKKSNLINQTNTTQI